MLKSKKYFYFIIFLFVLLIIKISFFPATDYINNLKVHYIDVGQGDSSLIEYLDKKILIDCGPNSNESNLLKYLNNLNITKIDYIFITHPHEDHIGNLDQVISKYKVTTIFMPKVNFESKDLSTSLSLIKDKNITLYDLNKDFKIKFNEDFYLEVFSSPKKNYENINNFSPLIKVIFKKDSFLFTGDNEEIGELEFINNAIDVDILKVGHHGSNTSSTDLFLKKVSPKISIISCGKNNSFNHPNPKVLERLNKFDNKIYRTDEDGTIIINSYGNSVVTIEKK
ncbi:ComEC/Rec2 family competence protein [Clostridium sp.]|uniref:ComEC/Rec2 family competence protein n=1 Tax=Clostridium sp. TaxID=1506 RepID=UPI00399116AC